MSGSGVENRFPTGGQSSDINCLSLKSTGCAILALAALYSTSDTVVLPQLQAFPISLRD